jgi:hypothetical protein
VVGDNYGKQSLRNIATGAGTGALLGGSLGGLSAALSADSPTAVNNFIKKAYTRAIKPSSVSKNTATQLDNYFSKVRQGLDTIVENKNNLELTDSKGRKVVGKPQTIEQATEAIEQTKAKIFEQYDAMAHHAEAADTGQTTSVKRFKDAFDTASKNEAAAAKDVGVAQQKVTLAAAQQSRAGNNVYASSAANQARATADKELADATSRLERSRAIKSGMQQKLGKVWVDLTPVSSRIRSIANDLTTRDVNPDLVTYINRWADRLEKRAAYSPSEAQDVIKEINGRLKNFYKNPSKTSTAHPDVDAKVVSLLREALDDTIARTEGPGYQDLKNKYGALAEMERDMARAALNFAKREPGGGILGRIADVASVDQLLHAVWQLDPTALAVGTGIRGFRQFTNWYRNPNRAVKQIFDAAENARTPPPPVPTEEVLGLITPAIGAIGSNAIINGTPPNDLRQILNSAQPQPSAPMQ